MASESSAVALVEEEKFSAASGYIQQLLAVLLAFTPAAPGRSAALTAYLLALKSATPPPFVSQRGERYSMSRPAWTLSKPGWDPDDVPSMTPSSDKKGRPTTVFSTPGVTSPREYGRGSTEPPNRRLEDAKELRTYSDPLDPRS